MDDSRIQAALDRTSGVLAGYLSALDDFTLSFRPGVRGECVILMDEVSVRIATCEVRLTRVTALIATDAEYHILRGYYHASPSLITFLIALYTGVVAIVKAIAVVNNILQVITGESLAHWIDKLFPGFENWWLDMMNKVSEISAALGWGVDGCAHLLNAFNASADIWCILTNKTRDTEKLEKTIRLQKYLTSVHSNLSKWQANPGEMIEWLVDQANGKTFYESRWIPIRLGEKIADLGDKATSLLKNMGTVTTELSAIQNDMPTFIAKHIPQGLWDALERADTTINDRIIPALTNITDRIDNLNAVMDSYRKKADELADRIAHPGDLLAEIDKLPSYARADQYAKLDGVTSHMLAESNERDYAALQGDLRNFAVVAQALSRPPSPLAFMELEIPGRPGGSVAGSRNTWFVGDF